MPFQEHSGIYCHKRKSIRYDYIYHNFWNNWNIRLTVLWQGFGISFLLYWFFPAMNAKICRNHAWPKSPSLQSCAAFETHTLTHTHYTHTHAYIQKMRWNLSHHQSNSIIYPVPLANIAYDEWLVSVGVDINFSNLATADRHSCTMTDMLHLINLNTNGRTYSFGI